MASGSIGLIRWATACRAGVEATPHSISSRNPDDWASMATNLRPASAPERLPRRPPVPAGGCGAGPPPKNTASTLGSSRSRFSASAHPEVGCGRRIPLPQRARLTDCTSSGEISMPITGRRARRTGRGTHPEALPSRDASGRRSRRPRPGRSIWSYLFLVERGHRPAARDLIPERVSEYLSCTAMAHCCVPR